MNLDKTENHFNRFHFVVDIVIKMSNIKQIYSINYLVGVCEFYNMVEKVFDNINIRILEESNVYERKQIYRRTRSDNFQKMTPLSLS